VNCDEFLFYFILSIHKPWKICIILSFRKDDSRRCEQCAKNIFLFIWAQKSFKIQCWRQNHKDAPSLHSCFPWKFTGKTNWKFTLIETVQLLLVCKVRCPESWISETQEITLARNLQLPTMYEIVSCFSSLADTLHSSLLGKTLYLFPVHKVIKNSHYGETPLRLLLLFAESGRLREHIRVHADEKPFCCSQCTMSFSPHRCTGVPGHLNWRYI
jgi:hypothetical protein